MRQLDLIPKTVGKLNCTLNFNVNIFINEIGS